MLALAKPKTELRVTGEPWRLGRARPRRASGAVALAGVLAVTLPLIGLLSLLLREQLDPQLHNHQAHFLIFGAVGAVAFALGYAAGEAANRRGDARILLLSLAFMATGGFMGLHAFGTAGVLFSESRAGFQIAIPVGLLVAGFFAVGSAFVDLRPELGPRLIRRRGQLRARTSQSVAREHALREASPVDCSSRRFACSETFACCPEGFAAPGAPRGALH